MRFNILKFWTDGVEEDQSRESRRSKNTELVKELRSRLLDRPVFYTVEMNEVKVKLNREEFLERFLRHHQDNVSVTVKALENYVNKNLESKAFNLKTTILKYPGEFHLVFRCFYAGLDHEKRPVAVIPDPRGAVNLRCFFDRLTIHEVTFLHDLLWRRQMNIENCVLEQNSDFAVVLLDVSKLKFKEFLHTKTIDFLLRTIKIAETYSPGVVGKVIIVQAPKVVKTLVQMVKSVVQFSTEIQIFGVDEVNWKERLSEHVPENLLLPQFGGRAILDDMSEF